MRPLNWTPQSAVVADRRKSKEVPVTFSVGGSQSSTPTDSLEKDPRVTLRNPRPLNRTSSAQAPYQRPFHHSVSGPLDARQARPHYQPSPRPHSENYSSGAISSDSLSRSNNSSQDSGLNESQGSNGSSKNGSWNKVVRRSRQGGGGGAGGQYQRSQSTTHHHQVSSGRGRRGRGGVGGARKPYSEPNHRHH